jgi:hypothetical protein
VKNRIPVIAAACALAAGAFFTLVLPLASAAPPRGINDRREQSPGAQVKQAGSVAASGVPAPPALPEEPQGKPIDFEPIPPAEEKPKAPKAEEWQSATLVRFDARGPRARACRMHRLREWVKVHCDGQATAVGFLGGSPDAAFFFLPQAKEGEPAPTSTDIVFPLKPGDRRVLEIFSYGPAYGGSMISPGLVLQEHWIAGEPAPVVVIR